MDWRAEYERSADEPRGLLIAFEGIDGSAKTTQAERYAARLRGRGCAAHLTREPSGGPAGTLLRSMLGARPRLSASCEAHFFGLLFAADRAHHVEVEVTPLMRAGYVVVSDRYDLSNLLYQSATAHGVDSATVAWLREVNKFAPRPSVTVVIDVDPATAARRRRARGGAEEIFDDEARQAVLADAYLHAEVFVPLDIVAHVDGDRSEHEVAEAVAAILDPLVLEKSRAASRPRAPGSAAQESLDRLKKLQNERLRSARAYAGAALRAVGWVEGAKAAERGYRPAKVLLSIFIVGGESSRSQGHSGETAMDALYQLHVEEVAQEAWPEYREPQRPGPCTHCHEAIADREDGLCAGCRVGLARGGWRA